MIASGVFTAAGRIRLANAAGGTRAYAHITGRGSYRLSLTFIAARVHGKCSTARAPVAEQELLELSGPVRV